MHSILTILWPVCRQLFITFACRASINGEANRASTAQVLAPHNASDSTSIRSTLPRVTAALLRDSVQADPSIQRTAAATTSSNELQPVFEVGGCFETRSLASLATELFKDPAFMDLCDKGLNGTLQRTKDGATAESRIQELAGETLPCFLYAEACQSHVASCLHIVLDAATLDDAGCIGVT